MYAIVEVAGFQYRVEQEQVIQVPLLEGSEGDSLTLDRVLLVENGGDVRVGTPTVDGASVTAQVLGHGKGEKIKAGRFLRRKDNRKRWGHRQDYTELKIAAIQG